MAENVIPWWKVSDWGTVENVVRKGVAQMWAELMSRLGYERFAAQGTDVGSGVAGMLPMVAPGRVLGVPSTIRPGLAHHPAPCDHSRRDGPGRILTRASPQG